MLAAAVLSLAGVLGAPIEAQAGGSMEFAVLKCDQEGPGFRVAAVDATLNVSALVNPGDNCSGALRALLGDGWIVFVGPVGNGDDITYTFKK